MPNHKKRTVDRPPTWLVEFIEAHGLSQREAQVLGCMVRGLTTKETAFQLGRSSKTVEQYWSRIYRKVGCQRREAFLASLFVWLTGYLRQQSSIGIRRSDRCRERPVGKIAT